VTAMDVEQGGVDPRFGLGKNELVELIEERDHTKLEEYGGVEGLCKKLGVDPETGITGDELRGNGLGARKEAFGSNEFKYPPPKSFFKLCFVAFQDLTILILSAAAILSLAINLAVEENRHEYGYLEGIAIIIVVMVVVLVQASIDYSKERKFRQLNSVKDNYDVQTIRESATTHIPVAELVVGDVVKLSAGDKVPADAILIHGSRLKTNESAMTGEPIDIDKDEKRDCFMLSGTSVSEGTGTAVIVAVGESSQWGIILAGLIVEPEDTPLQNRLDRLAMTIGKIGLLMATLTFFILLIRWIVDSARSGHWDGLLVLEYFIDAVTIVVVAVPEGLPLAITLGLAFAMRKMMTDQNLVRRLEACETMGSATQLNADKTGTLTQNRMTVVEALYAGQMISFVEGQESEVEAGVISSGAMELSEEFKKIAAVSMAVNTQANLLVGENGLVEHLGSKTECALLQHMEVWGHDYKALRDANPSSRIYLFDSTKKRMSTTQEIAPGKFRVHCKGAPEIVINICSSQLNAQGVAVPLTEEGRQETTRKVDEMASRGLRTLLLCMVDVDHAGDDELFWTEAPERDMTLIGVVGIKDPVRPETKEAVKLLRGAGVTVRMVTGDNPLTAKFIAKEAGILGEDDNGLVMEGKEFRKMSETARQKIALDLRVLARSTPNDKLMLVQTHKAMGEVVSVTGDGTNDAPALKEGNVGFALGMAGTEIAKEASDIIIMDDNISSMAKAVLWGRNVYDSIRKFLQFQLVVNVVAVLLNFISACAGKPLPLGAVPLLWVNMIMDSMGALALATEPPRMELMERKPFGRTAPLINRAMWRNIVGMSIYQLIVSLILQYGGEAIFYGECPIEDPSNPDPSLAACELQISSVIFNSFVFMQVFNEINSRRIDSPRVFQGILKSYYFLAIIVITIVIQILVMLLVGGTEVGNAIRIGEITGVQWAVSVIVGVIALPVGILLRLWPLEWCIGPMDDDPTEQSKLEKFLHLPKRKTPIEVFEDFEDMPDDDTEAIEMEGYSKVSKQILRLRVFVHAVAFINVVKRVAEPGDDPLIAYEPVKEQEDPRGHTEREHMRMHFKARVRAIQFMNRLRGQSTDITTAKSSH